MRKVIFSKAFSLAFIGFGLLITGWNTGLLLKGALSVEKVELTPEQIEALNVDIATKKHTLKELPLYQKIPQKGTKFGTLVIPKLKQSFPIFEGTSTEELKKGVGHFSKSVLPGEKNNCIISGHRDTVFRGLGNLKLHDKLIVTTDVGTFLYKINQIRIVDANDTTAMSPRPKATLTVTTCYPFYYIGNAPERYIIVAELISSKRIEI